MKKDAKDTKSESSMDFVLEYHNKFDLEDLDNRKLYLGSVIDGSSIDSVVYHILRYNRLDKGIPKEERKPIILYINSPGGNVSDGFGVIDAILTSETPVYTVNQALCASMGFLIFIAGHKRYSMPRAEFLLHDGSTFIFDSSGKAKDRIEFESVQLEGITKSLVIEQTKIESDLYDNKHRAEWWMLPKEAKELGVTDYIVGVDVSINEIV